MGTLSRTAIGSTMAREVVLDANVIVARLDEADALFQRADLLSQELRAEGAEPVLLVSGFTLPQRLADSPGRSDRRNS